MLNRTEPATYSTETRPGYSLAKGPIALLGAAGIAYGVLALIFGGASFALHIPHGYVGNGHLFGLLTNGWTDLLFIAGGLLLMISAPAHWLAKSAAMIVAIAFGAAAVIAVIRGNGVFGIFAANHWTEIIWGAGAVAAAVLSIMPRVGMRRRSTVVRQTAVVDRHTVGTGNPVDPRYDAVDSEPVASPR